MKRFRVVSVFPRFVASLVLAFAARAGVGAPQPTVASGPRTAADLTVADFLRPLAAQRASLNPAGTHLAMSVFEAESGLTGLSIYSFATKRTVMVFGPKGYDIYSFSWAGDEKIVYQVSRDNHYAAGLYAIRRDRPDDPITLNKSDVVQVLGTPRERPDNLLVWIRQSAANIGRQGDLQELNLLRSYRSNFGKDFYNIVDRLPPPAGTDVAAWMRDRAGEVRYVIARTNGVPRLYRRAPHKEWTALDLDLDQYRLLAVDTDPKTLLVARLSAAGVRELVRLNTVDGTTGPVLYTDEKYDFSSTAQIYFSEDEKEVTGLTYDRNAPTHVWFRDQEVALQRTIDGALPADRINTITGSSRDESRVLVRSASGRHPGALYLYEPKAHTLAVVGSLAPWLPEKLMGEVRLMTFKTRDGLRLEAYVTLPSSYVAGKPARLIVLPHGGPWIRDAWGYDPDAQFLASRGYVVFEPNYRGSAGYGAAISLTPRMEFRRMHDDVTDGTRALIKAGIADPAHIAIVGSGFGGYLAICGAAFEPELYRCAVTVTGIFDWEVFVRDASKSDPDSFYRDFLISKLGDPQKQREKFEALSPIHSVGQIKIPLFISQGENDHSAFAGQSDRLAKALTTAGVPFETMLQRAEGHDLSAFKNKIELYQRIESFLKKHL